MTLDLFHAVIVLDTSVLHNAGATSAPFQVLRGLVAGGLSRVLIPELAVEEFRTQWRDRNQTNIGQGVKALKALAGEVVLQKEIVADAANLSARLSKVDIESLSSNFMDGYLSQNGFEIIPLSFDQAKDAWKSYFIGNLPSKKAKHRPDIPDAHIVAALKELSVKEATILFASSDKGQREAASEIVNVVCFDNLEALIKSEQLKPLIAKWESEEKWRAIQKTLPFGEVAQLVQAFVQENGGELLSWEMVSDPTIPEDSHTALVSLFGEPEEVEIGEPQDWGGGLLRYNATYFSECLLEFRVFRGDAFDVPEWVSVSIGDFEKDHYFGAEGYAVVIAEVDVTVRINLDDASVQITDRVEDISFEMGSLELKLANYN
jgi:hypothetical protein